MRVRVTVGCNGMLGSVVLFGPFSLGLQPLYAKRNPDAHLPQGAGWIVQVEEKNAAIDRGGRP